MTAALKVLIALRQYMKKVLKITSATDNFKYVDGL